MEFDPVGVAPARRGWGGRAPLVGEIGKRVLAAVLTLIALCLMTFLITNARSAESVAIGQLPAAVRTDPVAIQAFIHAHHLDRPLPERALSYFKDLATLNLGTSSLTGTSVAAEIGPRLQRTAVLAALAMLISVPLAIAVGAASATRAGSKRGGLIDTATIMIGGIPVFVIGIAVLYVLAIWIQAFPVQSSLAFQGGGFADKAQALVLPAVSLVLLVCPHLIRLSRAAFRDVLARPYVQAAVLRGLPRRTVLWRYAAPNAIAVIVHAIALTVVTCITGALVIENVFGYPGLGQLLISSVQAGDEAVIQGGVVVTGAVVIGTSMLADVIGARYNPQLRA